MGGVRSPDARSVDDDNPAGSPKPTVNLRLLLAKRIAHLQCKNGRESQASGMKKGGCQVRISRDGKTARKPH